jgi:predicted secreted acid phosphatase
MKFPRLSVLLTLALLVLPVSQFAIEPANLNTAKYEIYRYVSSGSYAQDLNAAALRANKYLARRLSKPAKPGEKRAIVFDIDETTLSNLPHMMQQDFGYVPAVWSRWVASSQAKAIIPVQVGYDMAVHASVAVFFITARKESDRPGTERNLREVGYDTWTKIYFMPDEPQPVRLFKTGVRRQLVAEGYTIIANIGDQESDLAGGFAERTFKLPNPFYLVQ